MTSDFPSSGTEESELVSFADLRTNITRLLPISVNENLTVPTSFVALLHLANEKVLRTFIDPFFAVCSDINLIPFYLLHRILN